MSTEPVIGRHRVEPAQVQVGGDEPVALSQRTLMQDVRDLAVQFPDRVYQTERGREASAFLARRMKEIGLQPVNGSYFQDLPLPPEPPKDKLIQQGGPPRENRPPPVAGRNVVGFLEGSDPRLKDEVIIISAHHDSQPGTHQGANDNATGVAGVLAIAKMLVANPPKRSVLFVTFDGEEIGRKGSRYYAAHPLFPISKTALMVNMDMIGQVHLESGKRSEIYQWASGDRFATQVLEAASAKTIKKGEKAIAGYPEQPYENQFFTTDAEPLYRLGVPTVNFLSGRDLDNHAPEDGMDRVIPERLQQYVRLAHQVAVEGATHPRSLEDVLGSLPGGLMPSFPLIQHRKEAAGRSVHEERHRVSQIEARLPEFRDLSIRLVNHLYDLPLLREAKIDIDQLIGDQGRFISEVVLNRVREKHAALAEAYHDIPKYDFGARREAQKELDALSGIEGLLSGAIFLTKIRGRANDYQLARVPEKLRDMEDGAGKLGLRAVFEQVVRPQETKNFDAIVSPERAMEIAYDNVRPLAHAISSAIYALIDPHAAAEQNDRYGDRGLDAKTLDRLPRGGPLYEAALATLELGELTEYGGLKKGVRLAEVIKKVGAIADQVAKLPHAEAVTKELEFWKDWLLAFEKVEPAALEQIADRQRAVMIGWNGMLELWREMKPKITARVQGLTEQQLEFPASTRRELYYRAMDAKKVEGGRDPVAEMFERMASPLAQAEDMLRRLYRGSSPEAIKELPRIVDELELQMPGRAGKMRDCLKALQKLQAKQEVQIGHGQGNTPVRVLQVRAAFDEQA